MSICEIAALNLESSLNGHMNSFLTLHCLTIGQLRPCNQNVYTYEAIARELKCATTIRGGEKRRVLLSCVIPKTVTAKIYSGSPGESRRLRRALNSANTIARDFPTQRGKDSTTCFPALFGNCMAKPAYFTLGIVHDVTRANSPRRQLPQFTPILFPSIRPPKRSLDVTDPHRPSFSYTSNLDIFVITHEANVYLRDRCAKKSSATPGNSSRKTARVSLCRRKFVNFIGVL